MLRMLPTMLILMAGAAHAQVPPASAPEPLTLAQVYEIARAQNPRLRAAGALVAARASMVPSAATLPDPSLQLGLMNLSVPSLDADMPTSMAPSIQLMQMVPLAGKLSLAGRIARQSTAQAGSDADEAWWTVRAEAAMAYGMVAAADRQIEVMRETLRWLKDYTQVTRAMYASGAGAQSDVLRAGVEVARMEAELVRMEAMRAGAAARLNAVLNRPSETPVALADEAPRLHPVPDLGALRAAAAESRPMLESGRLGVARAETQVTLARRELWPDPVIGVAYGENRAGMGGTERMASVMVGFSLPVFAGRRQLRMRDEAAAMEQMARADLNAMQAQVDARLGALRAELERTRTLVTLYRADVLPQARANAESAFASYRVGRVDFMTLLDAQMAINQYEQELAVMLGEWVRDVAELEMTIGRELAGAALAHGEER
ncbi:MAG TPA: TolC family protein [Longimicrobiales bacterium]|nr:TolC family protein [Longimicrobiales bacterium]